jgi:uncharacterized protein YdeI (YjbR/CyaY-like superfamily)
VEPTYFATPAAWRAWLEKHHGTHQELLVGFYKNDSGKPSITWPESVDSALCFGWIDGVRRRIDEVTYTIRFTPRKARSTWSAVNIKRVADLTSLGLMHAAGIRAFEARTEERSRIYSFEQENVAFEAARESAFRANSHAWKFFESQAPSYKRAATWWVISAKKEETKAKRLTSLMEHSAQGWTLPQFTRASKPEKR